MYTGTVLVACMYGAGTGTGGGTVRTGTGPVTGYSASSSFCVVIVFLVTTLLNCLRKKALPTTHFIIDCRAAAQIQCMHIY